MLSDQVGVFSGRAGVGMFSDQVGVLSGTAGVDMFSDQVGVLSGRADVSMFSNHVGVLCGGLGFLTCSDRVGVLSGIAGIDDLLDLALLLKAPLLKIESPRRSPPDLGHVGSRGLSIIIDGGRFPTTLLTNLFSPRSILTWIMWEPPDLGLFSDGDMSSRISSVFGNGERRVPIRPKASRTDLDRWTRAPPVLCAIADLGLVLGLEFETRVGEDFVVVQVIVNSFSFNL